MSKPLFNRTVLITALIIIFLNTSAQNLNENLSAIIQKYASSSELNGCIIIAQNQQILAQGSFGIKKIDPKELNTLSTLFPIASLTKQFTSAAILLLQQKNKLSINDRISDYIDLPETMRNIKIINLMNHTSGIPDYWQNNIQNQKDSIYQFFIENEALDFPTNTEFSYCNSGYFILGEIIEKVSGKSYGEFLGENIFIPLGMSNTFCNDDTALDRAIGYDENWNKNDFLMTTGDGGLISNIEDLYIWDRALFDNKLLSVESKDLMFKPLILNSGETINYGFGWEINEDNNNIAAHTGWLASFGAYNQIDLETAYFVILLSNQIRPELMNLINDINKELYKQE